MANEEHLKILKQGVEAWYKWRTEKFRVVGDLSEAKLREADLRGADLSEANLRGADLRRADLKGAHLSEADLRGADLRGADLTKANLRGASLTKANLSKADLSEADLSEADLSEADLREANLTDANLRGADLGLSNLNYAWLQDSIFTSAEAFATLFINLDLGEVIGLESIKHLSASTIGTNTLAKSRGKIPDVFLRGCGLSDWEIEEAKLYNPDLNNEEINQILYRIFDLRATRALQFSSLFISYSHLDGEFVDKVGASLDKKGVRYWRDIHKATAGPLEEQVNRAIRQNPTVLVVLSRNSIKSDWVEHEVRKAREVGKDMGRHVLCPVALDDSWQKSTWPERVMEQVMQYNILDFSHWKDESEFDGVFRKLIDGLDLFYK